jgi:predicted dehydrogenase
MKTLLVGTGLMGKEYARVLQAQGIDFEVIGNSEESCFEFEQVVDIEARPGGIQAVESETLLNFDKAIVAVPVVKLYEVTAFLLQKGVRSILLEKPGALTLKEFEHLKQLVVSRDAKLYIAYNRRFYSSVNALKDMAWQDGGILSMNFEFTEWIHKLEPLNKNPLEMQNWFLANSTHVVDTAFFVAGYPKQISALSKSPLEWHSSSVFVGSGITEENIPFSYHSNWQSAGRWSVEVCTDKGKYILSPMESLQFVKRGTIVPIEINTENYGASFDQQFKPGLYAQIKAFIGGIEEKLCSIEEQVEHFKGTFLSILKGTK